jgi:hypothetical protein
MRNSLIFQQFTTIRYALRCIVETFEAEGWGFDSLRARNNSLNPVLRLSGPDPARVAYSIWVVTSWPA